MWWGFFFLYLVNVFKMNWLQVASQPGMPKHGTLRNTFLPEGLRSQNPFLLVIHKQKLAEWVAIQSVSAWPEKRGDIRRMVEVAAADIKQLGGSVELVDIGKQKVWVWGLGTAEPQRDYVWVADRAQQGLKPSFVADNLLDVKTNEKAWFVF